VHRILLLAAFLAFSSACWSQRLLTVPDFTTFSERDGAGDPGGTAGRLKLIRLVDGSTLVAGRFEVWYEGVRFRDLLRLKQDGNPDTSWRVLGNETFGELFNITVTPHGLYIVAGAQSGASPSLLWHAPLDGSRPLTPVPVLGGTAKLYTLSTFDRSDESLYAVTDKGIVRIAAATGQSTLLWNGSFGSNATLPQSPLVADSGGGLWSSSVDYSYLPQPYVYTFRTSIAALAADPAGRFQTTHLISGQLDYALVGAVGDYVYLGGQRQGKTGDRDAAWGTQYRPLLVSNQYAYVKAFDGLSNLFVSSIVRAPLDNSGVDTAWRFEVPPGFNLPSALVAWPTPGDAGNLGIIGRLPPVDNVLSPLALAVRTDLTDMTDPTVVEYYLPELKRYFITGRKNEQDLLDAMPQSFQRTGMTFAAKSSRYRDIPEQPVCRLYFPPANGGSNTHFYGVGGDCGQLNKLGGMKYEGFDFSVLKPAGGQCTATAPNAVTRLYNNKAATNESNHRYVVSTATKARMLAQGWIDEGTVFCVSSANDATL